QAAKKAARGRRVTRTCLPSALPTWPAALEQAAPETPALVPSSRRNPVGPLRFTFRNKTFRRGSAASPDGGVLLPTRRRLSHAGMWHWLRVLPPARSWGGAPAARRLGRSRCAVARVRRSRRSR